MSEWKNSIVCYSLTNIPDGLRSDAWRRPQRLVDKYNRVKSNLIICRDVRVVDRAVLERLCTETYPGFESRSLRQPGQC